MSKVKLIGIAPCYNEVEKGHLERFAANAPKVVDGLVLLDDASTDKSYERMLDITPHVLRNKKNMFMHEQFNQFQLIEKAVKEYPDLTHILNMNIDGTWTPACYRDGEALLHKACEEFSADWEMLNFRDVHLWRSTQWWRYDGAWRWRDAERIYVREHGLELNKKWAKGLHQGKNVTTPEHTLSVTRNKRYENALSIHWGFMSRTHIEQKVNNYLKLEGWRTVPCPDAFKAHSVYSLLDEYNLKVRAIHPGWFDEDLKSYLQVEPRKPKAISHYRLVKEYNPAKAECYKYHFEQELGYYSETEEYWK